MSWLAEVFQAQSQLNMRNGLATENAGANSQVNGVEEQRDGKYANAPVLRL